MPDRRDAELAKILARQPVQNLPVNIVFMERGRILLEPEATQPKCNIHFFCPGLLPRGSINTGGSSRSYAALRLRQRTLGNPIGFRRSADRQ
jgi:hypothetical protein